MPASKVKIGPFVGGLNTYSDPTAVDDLEVTDLINFEVDLDGSLVSRPPIVPITANPGDAPLHLLGYFLAEDGSSHLLGASSSATYYLNIANVWTEITDTFGASCFVQYANKAWLVPPPGSSADGGSWSPSAGFVAVAAMKKGSAAVVYKERMFIAEGGTGSNANRIYFSNPADITTWGASDFLDVKSGDGQEIQEMRLFMDVIVIFKQDSCYIYSYDTSPSRGNVRSISASIGIAGKDCVAEYENNLYIFHDKNVYSMINWNFEKLNVKVPFEYLNTNRGLSIQNYCVSLVGDRLVIRYYDRYYVYGLKTKVWTRWESNFYLGRFIQVPSGPEIPENTSFIISSATTEYPSIFSFMEGYFSDRSEQMFCSVTTKTYDFESPYTFKRLFWWGVDTLPKNNIKGTVFPVTYGRTVTWGELEQFTWEQLSDKTWGRPLDFSLEIDETISISNSNNSRMFVKFPKSLRFRQINFTLSGNTDGSTLNGPLRLYNLTGALSEKALVTKQIS